MKNIQKPVVMGLGYVGLLTASIMATKNPSQLTTILKVETYVFAH